MRNSSFTAPTNPPSEAFYKTFLLAESYDGVVKRHLVHDLISISQVCGGGDESEMQIYIAKILSRFILTKKGIIVKLEVFSLSFFF
jgi:hypothetical protein